VAFLSAGFRAQVSAHLIGEAHAVTKE
jgi:hypothetical protein